MAKSSYKGDSSNHDMDTVIIDKSTNYQIASLEQIDKIRAQMIVREQKRLEGLISDEKERSKKLAEFKESLYTEGSESYRNLIAIATKYEATQFQKLNAQQRRLRLQQHIDKLKQLKKEYTEEQKTKESLLAAIAKAEEEASTATDEKQREALNGMKQALEDQLAVIEKHHAEIAKIDAVISNTQKDLNTLGKYVQASAQELVLVANSALSDAEEKLAQAETRLFDYLAEQEKGFKEEAKTRSEYLEQLQKDVKEQKKQVDKRKKEADKAKAKANIEKENEDAASNRADVRAHAQAQLFTSEGIKNTLNKTLKKTFANIDAAVGEALNQIDNDIDSFYELQGKMEARLQGSDSRYKSSLEMIQKNIGISGLVSQKKVIENLQKLIDSGVNHNLELRAYLATATENIASTFDAFDSNLMRLIRVQQADSTAARLGIESALTKLFNEMYSDTSYLSDVFDEVSSAIIDANTMLTREMSAEFEYTLQKWLGSLYSIGLTDNTITTIAQGINYLATGNYEQLDSNEALRTLLISSADRTDVPYTSMLLEGLDANRTNKLLRGMIEHLQQIAENTKDNHVTRTAYATVYGVSNSDLMAIGNLSSSDIENLYSTTLNYSQAIQETSNQLSEVSKRIHLSQIMDTALENAMATSAVGIGSTGLGYGTWKILNIIEDLTGGIDIPSVMAAGFGLDLETTVTQLAKAGIAGLSLMTGLLTNLGGLNPVNMPNLSSWGDYNSAIKRGSGLQTGLKGAVSGFSESTEFKQRGNSNAEDIQDQSLSGAADDAEDTSKRTNKNTSENADKATEFYDSNLKYLAEICNLLAFSRIFYTYDSGLLVSQSSAPNNSSVISDISNSISSITETSANNSINSSLTNNDSTNETILPINSISTNINNAILDKLFEGDTNTVWDTISNMHASNVANAQAINVRIADMDSNPLKVNVENMSDTVNRALKQVLLESLAKTLIGEDVVDTGSVDQSDMLSRLRSTLENMSVNVSNTYLDDVLRNLYTMGVT